MQKLSHKKLDVCQRSIEFLAVALQLLESVPKGNAMIIDQLKRASTSVPLNIAEAAGYPSEAKRAHHYQVARGSALECGAALNVGQILKVGNLSLIPKGKELLVSVVSMLSKMCRRSRFFTG